MKIVAKKVIIYSVLGIMQVGMVSSVAAAAPDPLFGSDSQQIVQLDRYDNRGDDWRQRHDERIRREHERHEREIRQRQHDERMRREHERHEREMRRRHHESEREWRERQRRENEHHDREVRDIAAFLIGIAVGSASND